MNIHLIKNILKEEERKKLIKDCKPLLLDLGPDFPGKQSQPLRPKLSFWQPELQFERIHKIFLSHAENVIKESLEWDISWFFFTKGKIKNNHWHNHPVDYAGVYYMKTFPFFSNGTLFKDRFIKAPQNSLLIFPGHLYHTAPSSPLPFDRYTMSLNWNIKRPQ